MLLSMARGILRVDCFLVSLNSVIMASARVIARCWQNRRCLR
jgi:hypothetical protein